MTIIYDGPILVFPDGSCRPAPPLLDETEVAVLLRLTCDASDVGRKLESLRKVGLPHRRFREHFVYPRDAVLAWVEATSSSGSVVATSLRGTPGGARRRAR